MRYISALLFLCLLGCKDDKTPNPSAPVLPTIETSPITAITGSSAVLGGNVISTGGVTLLGKGIDISSNANAATADVRIELSILPGETGAGAFDLPIGGLISTTTYYVRAYATNIVGTAYGQELSFTTLLTDADGNPYTAVTIGTQVWLKEDLKTSKFATGADIPASGWSYYDNNPANNNPYGKLYSFASVADPRKLCPSGYHVASESDWETLIAFLGGTSVAGGKMKEAGITHWADPNTGATNSSGFTALPGGRRADDGTYAALTFNSIWWSSTDFPGTGNALYYSLFNSTTTTFNTGISKNYQMSVRCVKD